MKLRIRVLLILILLQGLPLRRVQAEIQVWDDNPIVSGAQDGDIHVWGMGSGNNWWNLNTSVNGAWREGDDAVFGATFGENEYYVELHDPIVARGLVFAGQKYSLTNRPENHYTLTLDAGGILAKSDATIDVPLIFNMGQTFSVASGKQLVLNGDMSSTVFCNLTKTGPGSLVLAGTTSLVGGIAVSSGTLILDYRANQSNKLSDNRSFLLQNACVEVLGGSLEEVFSSTSLSSGASHIIRNSGTSTLRLKAITRSLGSTLDLSSPGIASTTSTVSNGILGAFLTVGGEDWASRDSSGSIVPCAGSVYTDVSVGMSLGDTPSGNFRIQGGASGLVTLAGSTITTINTLKQNSAFAATIDTTAKTLRLAKVGGILLPEGKGDLTIGTTVGSGNLTANALSETGELIFQNHSAVSSLIVNSKLVNSTKGSLVAVTKSGIGRLILNGENTFSGGLFLNEGILSLNHPSAWGVGSMTISGGSLDNTSGTELVMTGNNLQNWNASFSFLGTNPLNLGKGIVRLGNACELTVEQGTLTVEGPLTSNGYLLTKLGPGSLLLSSPNNSLGGGVVVSEGILGFSQGALSSAELISMDGGTLRWNAENSDDVSSHLAFVNGKTAVLDTNGNHVVLASTLGVDTSASLTKIGQGTLTLTGLIQYSGKTRIEEGTLVIDNGQTTVLGVIEGTAGNLQIGASAVGTTLFATSIVVDSLVIGSPSLATVVPEPNSLAMLLGAGFVFCLFKRVRRGR